MVRGGALISILLALMVPQIGLAAEVAERGGGAAAGGELAVPSDDASSEISAIHAEMVTRAQRMGVTVAPQATAVGKYQFPLRSQPSARGHHEHGISNHVDLDPTTGLKAYDCGSRTYDGHQGTDLFLTPYAWDVMARKEVAVVAGLGGTIVAKQDGQFDQQCSWGGTQPANYVVLAQDDGLMGYYFHMKAGTVTTKAVGSRVATGEILGTVGSSGRSTGPHLHFELRTSSGQPIEPAHGACNTRATSWTTQAAALDTTVVRVATHTAVPPAWTGYCDKPDPKYKNTFVRGNVVYFASYLRDQPAGVPVHMDLLRPDGSLVFGFDAGSPSSGFYKASYWYGWYTLPSNAPLGNWRVRATLKGKRFEHVFRVGTALPTAKITAAITGASTLTLPIGKLVTTKAKVTNTSTAEAVGCFVSDVRPLMVTTGFQATGETIDRAFSVPAGGSKEVTLRLTAWSGFAAKSATVPVFVRCGNSDGAPFTATTQLVVSSP